MRGVAHSGTFLFAQHGKLFALPLKKRFSIEFYSIMCICFYPLQLIRGGGIPPLLLNQNIR